MKLKNKSSEMLSKMLNLRIIRKHKTKNPKLIKKLSDEIELIDELIKFKK